MYSYNAVSVPSHNNFGGKLQSGKDTLFNHELPEPTGKKKFALGAKKIQKILPGQRGSSSICDDDLG